MRETLWFDGLNCLIPVKFSFNIYDHQFAADNFRHIHRIKNGIYFHPLVFDNGLFENCQSIGYSRHIFHIS